MDETTVSFASRLFESPDVGASELTAALGHSAAVVRLASGIRLSQTAPSRVPLEIIREMATLIARGADRQSSFEELRREFSEATGEDLEQAIVEALAEFDADRAGFIIPELISRFAAERQFYELIHTAIALAFPEADAPVAREELTPVQFDVLTSALSNDAIWLYDLHVRDELLPCRGLPGNRSEMEAFLYADKAK